MTFDEWAEDSKGKTYADATAACRDAFRAGQLNQLFHPDAEKLRTERRQLAEGLLKAEWVPDADPDNVGPWCPVCGNDEPIGHTPDCDGAEAYAIARRVIEEG